MTDNSNSYELSSAPKDDTPVARRKRWLWFWGLYVGSVVLIGGGISFLHWAVMHYLP